MLDKIQDAAVVDKVATTGTPARWRVLTAGTDTEPGPLAAQYQRLLEAFRRYGWHMAGCPAEEGAAVPCTCGYAQWEDV